MALFTILRRFFPVSRFGIEYPRVGCAPGGNRPNKINNLLSIVRALYVAACCSLFAFISGHFRAFLKFHGNSMRHDRDMKRVGRRDPQIRCSTPPQPIERMGGDLSGTAPHPTLQIRRDYPPGWFSDQRYIACEPSHRALVEGLDVNLQHSTAREISGD